MVLYLLLLQRIYHSECHYKKCLLEIIIGVKIGGISYLEAGVRETYFTSGQIILSHLHAIFFCAF